MTRLFLRVSGLTLLVRGRENIPPGPVVLALNHTSYLDALVLVSVLAPRDYAFIAKREFLGNPMMRLLLRGFGCLFVERFDVQRSAEHADELVDAAKRGRSLAIFPEGTLQRRPGLMPFRTGAFQVAVQAGVRAGRAARRALGAARRHLVRAPPPDGRHLRRADRARRR